MKVYTQQYLPLPSCDEDKQDKSRNILLSLKKEPYDNILSGQKKFEYRTRFFQSPSKAYIYLSKHGCITAIIDFDFPILGSCEEISRYAAKKDHANYETFMTWLHGRSCYRIPIKSVTLIEPIMRSTILSIFPNFTVPQSYHDLDKKQELLSYLNANAKVIRTISFL